MRATPGAMLSRSLPEGRLECSPICSIAFSIVCKSGAISERNCTPAAESATLASRTGRGCNSPGRRRRASGRLERGWFVRPTIFSGVRNDMRVAREEIFGPVLCVLSCRDEKEAISIANDTHYGPQANVFSSDLEPAQRANDRIEGGLQAIRLRPRIRRLRPRSLPRAPAVHS